jgi:hypothetical protein
LKKAGIDISKPMIFYGGLSSFAVRAACNSIGSYNGKIYEKTYESWNEEFKATIKQ